ncbi:MAG: phosphodiesterase [Cocleimonas sp.]
MVIVQISDTHIAGWDKKTYGVADMADNLACCVSHINQINPKADVVLVTGDISNTGSKEEYKHAKSLLDELDAPYFVIPGNHDSRKRLVPVFGDKHCTLENGFVNYVIDDYAVRLIAVDSAIMKQSGGKISKKRADWLEQQLAKETEKPTILFMHHPPLKLGVIETDIDGFIGSEILGNIVEKYANIERIICGHIHLPTCTRWHGTIVSTAPSTGMPLLLDLTKELVSLFTLDDPAYQIHHWTPEKNLVTHTITVKDRGELHPFQNDPPI